MGLLVAPRLGAGGAGDAPEAQRQGLPAAREQKRAVRVGGDLVQHRLEHAAERQELLVPDWQRALQPRAAVPRGAQGEPSGDSGGRYFLGTTLTMGS